MKKQGTPILFGAGNFLPLLVILFVGSGCAALIYEVIWLQMLQLVVGATSVSLGVLLGTFMGGMCLGSLFLPRLVALKHHPLQVYAFLELGIGLFGLLILYGMPLIQNVYTGIAGYGLSSVFLRSLIAIVCLLPPTIMMGATLPAISRWVESTPKGVSWMGFFYGGNIFGAVAGCLLAGFYLLRVYDIAIASYVAIILNIFVAGGALYVSRITLYQPSNTIESEKEVNSPKMTFVFVAIALSGMAALGSEVIWTRLLSIMLGYTVYTFSIILAEFLVGLGIGSAIGSVLSRKSKNPILMLALCQLLLVPAMAWTSYVLTDSLPYQSMNVEALTTEWYVFQFDLARSAIAIVIPAIFWGASFPLALAAVASEGQDPARLVGRVYAFNTIGAIIGAVLFSLIGIPILGTALSQKIIIVISAVSALTMFSQTAASKIKSQGFSLRLAVITSVVLLLVSFTVTRIHTVPWFSIAYGRYASNYNYLMALNNNRPDPNINIVPLYVGEGLNGSVAVTEFNGVLRQFHSVGKVQASTDPRDMRLQRMLGHITGLLTNKPESVLVIGCGAGITAGSFLTQPGVQNVTVCDIESLIPKVVAPMFSKENYGIADGIEQQNPHIVNGINVKFEYDDGRHFLTTSGQKYDIISADPIDPWSKGAAALYSLEFFKTCKEHLKPGGAMSLWVPLYESSPETVKSTISTFFKVFPEGIIFSNDTNGEGYDIVLFGQANPAPFDVDLLDKKWQSDANALARRSLSEVGFNSPYDLLSTYAGRGADLQNYMSDAEINTDRNLRLGYLAGMALNSYRAAEILTGIVQHYQYPRDLFLGSSERRGELFFGIEDRIMRIKTGQAPAVGK